MRTPTALLCASAVALGVSSRLDAAATAPPTDPKNSPIWWIATYGVMDDADPLAKRAQDVFRRVAAAADKRSNRLPKLVLLRRPPRAEANALPDGSVVVTRDALKLCYRDGRDAAGDAKL